MVFQIRNLYYIIFFVFVSGLAKAQVSPATSTYLRPVAPTATNTDSGFEGGRFVVRPSPVNTNETTKENGVKEPQTKVVPTETKVHEKSYPKLAYPAQISAQATDAKTESKTETKPVTKTESVKESASVPEFSNMIFGGESADYEKYLSDLNSEDPRLNILNISFAPGYYYLDSSSAYWFRDYESSGPSVSASADVWISPFFGIHADYFTTLAADLKSSPGNSKEIVVDHRYLGGGFQLRKFSSTSRRAKSFTIGLLYSEYEMIVPREETNRIGVKMSGPDLFLGARIPSEIDRAWLMEFDLYPSTKVSENATAINVKSGTDVTSYGLKATLGREWVFDRNSNMFLKLSHRVDKTIYEGAASQTDPRSNTTPSGVSVTSGATLLECGFTWGD